MLNNSDINEPILADSNDKEISKNEISMNAIPPPTKWKVVCSCCCCGPCVQLSLPNSQEKRYFLQGWECRPCMPIVVSILILYTTITHFVCFFPYQYYIAQIVLPIFISIFFVLFVWCYFAAVCMDPGYLPYNWVQTKKFKYNWEEQLSGLAVSSEQYDFALTKENRPPKSSFSHSAGRYVIRADHICGWVANWIGKRNHKQFILMNLYGGLFALSLSIGPFCVKQFFSLPLVLMFTGAFAFAIEISFAFSLLSMFVNTIIDLSQNRTKLHRMRDEVKDENDVNNKTEMNETIIQRKISMKASMQEVFGNGSYCSWLIPLPAFDDSLIIDDDPTEIFQPVEDDDIPQYKAHSNQKDQNDDIENCPSGELSLNNNNGVLDNNNNTKFNDDGLKPKDNSQQNDNAQMNNDNSHQNDENMKIDNDNFKLDKDNQL